MTLSIILPVCDGTGLTECLDSVDESDVEIVVVANGPKAYIDPCRVDRSGVRVVRTARLGLANACQHGAEAARSDRMLFMNADCRFQRGSIAAMERSYERGTVLVGEVHYSHDTYTSRIVDRLYQAQRRYPLHTFQPNLMLDTSVAAAVGGYIFDKRLLWTEDADLHRRVVAAGVPIRLCAESSVVHVPQTLRGYLGSAGKYGVGRAQAEAMGLTGVAPVPLRPGVLAAAFKHDLSHAGLVAAIYGQLWFVTFLRSANRNVVLETMRPKMQSDGEDAGVM